MSELTKEQFEQLPEFIKDDYEQVGDVWKHAGMLKVKQTADNLDGKLKETNQRLTDFEKNQQEAIEKAKAEALEEARSKGDVKAIEERYQQQMEDLNKRHSESESQYKERMEKMEATIKQDKKRAIISELAEDATDKGRKAFKALIAGRVDIDAETGKATFLNEDGSASSLDMAGFKAEILKDDSYSPLLKADIVTSGGGGASGSTSRGSASQKTVDRVTFDSWSPSQKRAFTVENKGVVTDN